MSNALILFAVVRHIEPVITRRVVVPAEITLLKLHTVLQIVFDWDDCHLWQFEFGTVDYTCPNPYAEDDFSPPGREQRPAKSVKLDAALGTKKNSATGTILAMTGTLISRLNSVLRLISRLYLSALRAHGRGRRMTAVVCRAISTCLKSSLARRTKNANRWLSGWVGSLTRSTLTSPTLILSYSMCLGHASLASLARQARR